MTNRHKHKYTARVSDGAVLMECSCGVNIRSILQEVTLIDYVDETPSGVK